MIDRPTAAYPPGPRPPIPHQAATLLAEGSQSNQETLFAGSPATTSDTVFADGGPSSPTLGPRNPTTLPPGSTRSIVTVLPEVRSEGEQLVLIPRDKARYEPEKLLGRGGMGEVKLAHDHDIGRKIAVKRLLDEGNPHAVARFIDEVRTIGSLEHPNIVPIHDVGVDERGSLFFVMKYVEGETLASIIAKLAKGDPEYHARYTFERRLDLFAGLLRALEYAHSQGLVHRDVKPENVMVGRFGEVVLMDWGIAHVMRSHDRKTMGLAGERASTETVDGSLVGTPQYMSPEQAAGQVAELDGRSDLYSAFVVLWELLTLTPYVSSEGKSAIQTIVAAQQRQYPSAIDPVWEHPHQKAIAVELRHYLRYGLMPNKQDRYASVSEAITELERVRAGDFGVHCSVTFMKHNNQKLVRFMDRHPIGSLGLAIVSALVLLGGLGGWVAWAL